MPRAERRRLSRARVFCLALVGAAAVTAFLSLAPPAHAAASATITKQVVGEGPATTREQARTYEVGVTLRWQYVITNTGTEPLKNPRVTDDQGNPVTGCPALIPVGQSGTCGISSGTIGGGVYGAPASAPTLDVGLLPLAVTDTPYEWPLSRTGSPSPVFSVTGGSLPPGLKLDSSGVISGTATTAGTATFSVAARNAAGTATQSYTMTVRDAAPAINSMNLANPTSGKAYFEQVYATGKNIAWSVSAGALPTGLSLNSASGVISGTPTTEGSSTFTIRASNSGGAVTRAFTLAVQAAAPTMSNTTMADARYGTNYSQQVPGVGKNLSYRVVSGSLPTGFSMSTTGLVTGTSALPWTTMAGQRGTFSVEVSNAAGSATATMNFLVYPAPPPAMSYSTNQVRTVVLTTAGSSALSEACVPNTTIDLTGVTITSSNGGTLTDKSMFNLKCATGNILTKGAGVSGTYVFTLVRENITLRRAFTMTITVTR